MATTMMPMSPAKASQRSARLMIVMSRALPAMAMAIATVATWGPRFY